MPTKVNTPLATPPPADPRAARRAQQVAAGRKGGQAIAATRGPEFYRQIGAMGGRATSGKGKAHFQELGAKGAAALRAKLGEAGYRAHLSAAGAIGGAAPGGAAPAACTCGKCARCGGAL